MTLLRDLSLLWSMLHVIALFLILFEPRFSWRTTLTVAFVVGGTLLIANILLMYQLGNGILMSMAFFPCTIPTLILFSSCPNTGTGGFSSSFVCPTPSPSG